MEKDLSFEMKSNLNDKIIDDFLNAQTKLGTFKTYKTQMKLYLEYTGKTGQQLIDEKHNDTNFQVETSIFGFRKWLLQKGKSENYATSTVGAIRGFYSYYRMPLMFRKQESRKLTEKNRTTTDYLFDREDLAKMALAGNLKERYVLLVGKSIGLRASDFLRLTYGQLRSVKLEGEAPVAIGELATQKERIKAYPFLDSDALPIVKAILEANKDKADHQRILTDTEDNLSVILQTLAKKAGMEIENGAVHGKRIRFHCLRKFLIDRLSAYAGESQWKQIVGKAIDEGAYVSQDQLRGVFTRAMKDLLINGNGVKAKKIMELENALIEGQRRITAFETTNETLRNRMERLEQRLIENNLSINKQLANIEQEQRNQSIDILQLQDKAKIKPKPIKRFD
jgi:hypothetical protein